MPKRFVISGIGKGPGGVGRFIEYLDGISNQSNLVFIYPKRSGLKNAFLRKVIENLFFRPLFRLKVVCMIKPNDEVVVLHQQTVGYWTMRFLLSISCRLTLYIMDNGFFCVKAYNYLDGTGRECFECLQGEVSASIENNCRPQPAVSRREAVALQRLIREKRKDINFLVLSDFNGKLLRASIGSDIEVSTRYFQTYDLLSSVEKGSGVKGQHEASFDVVLHAASIEPKGFLYFLELVSRMPHLTFFVPAKTVPEKYKSLANLAYSDLTWETGLREVVQRAGLVVTPSLWSFTPEAATLKSLIFNGCVAVVKNKYGFSNEMQPNSFVPLSGSAVKDVVVIQKFFDSPNKEYLKEGARSYVAEYFKKASNDTSIICAG